MSDHRNLLRFAAGVSACIAFASPSLSVECPLGSSAEPLVAFNWSYTVGRVMVAVRNTIDREIRMVDADVYFVDGLDRMVGNAPLPVDPDLAIFPSNANSFRVPAPPGYDRLELASLEDFELTMCTRAILFKDGTKVTFAD